MLVSNWRKYFAYPENEGGADPDPADTDEGTEPDPDADEGTEPDPAAASTARKETRQQRLANEARTEREARIRLEGEVAALRNQSAKPPVDDAEAKRVREEKLSIMDVNERKLFLQDEQIAELRKGQQLTQLQIQDATDKSAYAAKAATDPIYKKHQAQVEQALGEMRKNGYNNNRETILAYIIGQNALKGGNKAVVQKKKATAATRVDTAKGAPISARGDAGTKKGGDDSAEVLRQKILSREARGDM